jgi:hypothetical protein
MVATFRTAEKTGLFAVSNEQSFGTLIPGAATVDDILSVVAGQGNLKDRSMWPVG